MKLFLSLATCLATIVQGADTNSAPKSAAPTALKVADFDKGELETFAGMPWIVFTDETVAGKSSLKATLSSAGADKTKGAMLLAGKLTPDFQYGGFAGVTTHLLQSGASTNLTRFTGIQFQARGDNKLYRVAIGKENVTDYNNFSAEFRARPEWTLVKVPFTDLAQSPYFGKQVPWSATNITSVAFMAMAQPAETREFKLEIDAISFY